MSSSKRTTRALLLVQKMLEAHESEISCSECAEKMDCLAELKVVGKTPEGALEAIERHVECCHCCAAEFEALLAILKMESSTETHEA